LRRKRLNAQLVFYDSRTSPGENLKNLCYNQEKYPLHQARGEESRPMLRFFFLGAYHVTLASRPSPRFQTNKVRALLAYLVLEADRAHERTALVGLFWPEMPEARALNNLSKALGLLRQALWNHDQATPYLLVSRQTVRFNPDSDYWLDVAEFQRCVAPQAGWPQLEGAAALYGGEFLSGFSLSDAPAFEEWLLLWRERLHQQTLAAMERLTTHNLAVANYEQAQHYARRQLELDAWREAAHAQLMRALALTGKRSAALEQYETCRRLLADELGVEPAAETVALYESIKAGNLAPEKRPKQRPIPHNLPSPPTTFVGRQRELAALDDLIRRDQSRLVTIIGPGGIGKTRFALAYAEHYLITSSAPPFPDGVYFIPLVNLNPSSDTPIADQIILAITAAIKLSLATDSEPVVRPLKQQLLDYLRQKRLVLLLDNFDDLLIGKHRDGEALLAEIAQAAPQVGMIVTSRERLRLYGERVFTLPGLTLPDLEIGEPADQPVFNQAEAMQLFVRTARRAQHDFQLEAGNWRPVAQLCHFLGGMPLAIEVAASWVDTLSLLDILAEMQRDLDFLSSDLLDVDSRHRSIGKVLDYTWQRLPPNEQLVLAALSVFRGGFTRRAAQAIAMQASATHKVKTQTPTIAPAASPVTLSLLRELVQKSLLFYNPSRDRYEIHELLRRFVLGKLASYAGYETAVRQRHSAYYCAALQKWEADLKGSRQQRALAEIEADIENVRVAWRWAVEHDKTPQIAAALGGLFHFYDMRSWFQEGEQVFREAARRLRAMPTSREHAITVARLQARAGWFAFHLGQHEESVRLLQDSLVRLRQQGAEAETAFNLNYLGAVLRHQGEYKRANHYLSEALCLARTYADDYQASISLNILGQTASLQGDYTTARRYCQEGLSLKRALGDHWGMTYSLTYLGRVARAVGEYEEAQRLFQESMGISKAIGDQRGVAFALQNLAGAAEALGQYSEAEKLYSQGLNIFRHIGNPLGATICLIRLAEVATTQDEMAAARRHLREGLQIALETGSTPNLLAGLLGLAGFWLKSDHPQGGIACLAFIENYPDNDPALQARAQQLKREWVTTLASTPPADAEPLSGKDDLMSFVKEWIVMLS
jgi:DNA-binding SARP family transcriptional activator/predicted ATPase